MVQQHRLPGRTHLLWASVHYLPTVLRPADRALLAHITATARGGLGGPALAQAWAEGERMPLARAIDLAQSL